MTTVAPRAARTAGVPAGCETVAEYGTDLQVTRVLRTPDGAHLWWQGPGAQVAGPLRAPAAALVADLPEPPPGAALLTVPEPWGDGLLHRVAGPSSAAAWLRDFRPQARALVAHALASVGPALRTLHEAPVPAHRAPPLAAPPGVRRLRDRCRSDGELRRRTLAVWGTRRMARLLDWADVLAPEPRARQDGVRPLSPVHGWASLGALVPPLSRGRAALLTGEDLGLGRPELDLGWLLGELAELDWTTAHQDTADLRRLLVRAYGPGPDPVLVGRAAVLRVVTHMQDFATYRGWDDELLDYIAFTAELIDEEGRRAVPQGVS
ncbi:hypothetical protein [Streptomyces sp. NPDC048606]|uniref:hypothetical protein n=1 Tax=Streptomyces sp. NPDC048606 TaxID=3154726 RepID=UPI00342D3AC8